MATQQQLDRLKAVVPDAQFSAKIFGVPASITLAQWILESGWGTSELTLKANNCFGVKHSQKAAPESYVEMPTSEFVDGKRVPVLAQFVSYSTVGDSFKAHARLLAQSARYAPAMACCHDAAGFAVQLQRCGYSTNPNYAAELLHLVQIYNLAQYDLTPSDEPAQQLEAA